MPGRRALSAAFACAAFFVTPPASAAVDFARDIQPLFEKHCYECHGPKKQTQLEDGSWLVHTRSLFTQIYFESGFPHGADQFISSAATHWATQALLLSLPDARPEEPGKVAAR
jgi:hypothetical protein